MAAKKSSYQKLKEERDRLYNDIFIMVDEPEGRGAFLSVKYKMELDIEKQIVAGMGEIPKKEVMAENKIDEIGSCLIPSFAFSKDGNLIVRGLFSIKKDNLHDTINERFRIKCFIQFLDQHQGNLYKRL